MVASLPQTHELKRNVSAHQSRRQVQQSGQVPAKDTDENTHIKNSVDFQSPLDADGVS
jgi:hypothetical protein